MISNLYAETESINEAKKRGMIQYVNKSVDDNGIKVTIDSIQLYGDRWSIEYTIEDLTGNRNFGERQARFDMESIGAEWNTSTESQIQILKSNGNINRTIKGFYNQDIISTDINKIKRKFDLKTTAYLNNKNEIPDKLIFEFKGIECKTVNENSEKFDGEWNVEVEVDKDIFDIETIIYEKDKVIDINGLKFNIEKIEANPTYTKMVISEKDFEEMNKLKIDDLKGLKLVSENKVYDLIKQINRDHIIVGDKNIKKTFKRDLYFTSVYFDEFKELKLVSDGGVLSSRTQNFIEYDVNDNKLKSNGLSYFLENGLEKERGSLYFNHEERELYSLGLSSDIDYIPELFDRMHINSRYSMIDYIIDDNGNIYDWAFTKKEVRDKFYYNIAFSWINQKGRTMENGRLLTDDKEYKDEEFVKPNKIYIYLQNPIKDVLDEFEVKISK